MVDVTFEETSESEALIKLQSDTWELNIRASLTDIARLHDIDDADWDARRSLQIGTSAGAHVFWTLSGDQATILVGHDDETWDFALLIPLTTVQEIAAHTDARSAKPT